MIQLSSGPVSPDAFMLGRFFYWAHLTNYFKLIAVTFEES